MFVNKRVGIVSTLLLRGIITAKFIMTFHSNMDNVSSYSRGVQCTPLCRTTYHFTFTLNRGIHCLRQTVSLRMGIGCRSRHFNLLFISGVDVTGSIVAWGITISVGSTIVATSFLAHFCALEYFATFFLDRNYRGKRARLSITVRYPSIVVGRGRLGASILWFSYCRGNVGRVANGSTGLSHCSRVGFTTSYVLRRARGHEALFDLYTNSAFVGMLFRSHPVQVVFHLIVMPLRLIFRYQWLYFIFNKGSSMG